MPSSEQLVVLSLCQENMAAVCRVIAVVLLVNVAWCNGLWLSRSWIVPNTTPIADEASQTSSPPPLAKKIQMHNVELEHLRRLAERMYGVARPSQPFGRPRYRYGAFAVPSMVSMTPAGEKEYKAYDSSRYESSEW